ncbi:MAG TPA: restriction endonuclease subunit S [candidate division WOR-3 bacterium]|uniref:Restriction endonuclease subunit S n=1 Tax=candidate division WOR-3 bacterium TaxID=2052148 RepID=A0A9C9K081_UNCW3|nr:restriction endonuclease subunit S [candidate division WOR-3 bacterium]
MRPAVAHGTQTTARRYRPYPRYKDSGIEWLGEIPEHWEIKRLKYVTRCLDGRRIPLNAEQRGRMQGEYPYWGANGIVDYLNDWLFDEKLVLLGEDGAPFFERFKDVAFFVTGKVWVNNHIHVLRALRSTEPRYLVHVLNMTDYAAFIDGTTRDKLTQDKMNHIPVLFPPVDEQRAIAAFLDRETVRIDVLIEKKERQIELLQEKRAAGISHAVTKGLNPNVKMKDSGIEWLGEIPEHWEVKTLKRVFRILNGSTPKSGEPSYWDGDIPWATPDDLGSLQGDTLFSTRRMITEDGYNSCGTTLAPAGSLVLSTRAPIGHLAIAAVPLCTNQGCRCLVFHTKDETRFFYYQLLTARQELESWGQGSTFQELSRDKLGAVYLVAPPVDEQRAIAAFLDRETARIDALIEKIRKSIELLREYRTALISACVTGKIDVREEVA